MPEHKGISCELHVEGQKATEYQVTQAGYISTSHIISQEDKIFSFHLNIVSATLGSVGRLDLELWADGQKLDAFTFIETDYFVDDPQVQDSTGAVKVVKLRFAKLKTVDEKKSDQETRQDILQKLGTLEIKLWRAHQDATQTCCLLYEQEPSKNPIHEKSIKGESITHCTEFANAKHIQNPSWWGYWTRKIDPYETPWVTFVFRHASKSLLESAGIIPKDSTKKHQKVELESELPEIKTKNKPEKELDLPMTKISKTPPGKKRRLEYESTSNEEREYENWANKRSRYNIKKHWPSDS
ncbi:hypothetical protein AOL_s00176g21 [Orbilia oligospora ATCC 24927]|uniref:DUF7918 domain-containing protein n=1 Tax=Arthrobotrys oligospora (strain ATCC 24927 / CBS 115.81 / DSM 1491) TaxID=756982 RepID=G1XPP7_ARTOA|nr:hypothetical protein AOL_s00176g21 [Orbilia oligospora ATCC 24927]EGX44850.1 hypothetical protein AOL_s00176g21 [Orbilia oligospora ATCC 24927]